MASQTIFVGLSGGVDSSVAAALLQQQGYHVVGVYMKNWSQDLPGMQCPWAEDLADAKRVAVQLGIDFQVFDFEHEYKDKVVDYMLAEFKKGRTPNPDIMCNQEIKFKLFYDVARERGADLIATGHYAQIMRPAGETGPALLARAVDDNKDQTYFLYRISQAATDHTLFPIGHFTKPEVKQLAAKLGLKTAHKPESMGVCFVGEVEIKDFLQQYIDVQPGEIREAETDQVLGHHEGVYFYTLGQRHGLYLGGGLPYYVVKKDLKRNIVYVSKNLNSTDLWTRELTLTDVIWRGKAAFSSEGRVRPTGSTEAQPAHDDGPGKRPAEQKVALPLATFVRLRHRAPLIPASFDGHKLTFKEPIKKVAPGQSAVLYGGPDVQICLGGGIVK